MSGTSNISWTDASWNPVTGCTKISPGCEHCYAREMTLRIQRMGGPAADKYRDGFKVTTHRDVLGEPLSWRKPRKVFVCSMSDLFHDDVPDDFVIEVFRAMHRAPWHTYQILTKRPDRMLAIEKHPDFPGWLPGMWMGVTIECRECVVRADRLRQCHAKVKWISAEPLLTALNGLDLTGIDWIVVAGETGRSPLEAIEIEESSVDEIIRWADARHVPVFVKQMGTHWAAKHRVRGHAKNPAEWPERFRRQEFPQ